VLEGQLYLVDFNENTAELNTCLIAKTNMGWFWHCQLANVGMKNLQKLLKGEHILGLTNVHFEKDRVCSACQAGKQVGAHHPHKNIMTTDRPLELLHMDLFSPIAYISIGGSKYCLVTVDDYSRFTWVFFLQEKSQTQETLKGFLRQAQNEFGLRVKKIRSDNGTEFKNSQIEGFLEDEGIKHEFSSPYTPQQNGVVERKNRTLLDMARTMLDETRHQTGFGVRRLTQPATPSTDSTFTEFSRRHHMNSSLVKSPMFHILEDMTQTQGHIESSKNPLD
jgi:transposase InsO family protein